MEGQVSFGCAAHCRLSVSSLTCTSHSHTARSHTLPHLTTHSQNQNYSVNIGEIQRGRGRDSAQTVSGVGGDDVYLHVAAVCSGRRCELSGHPYHTNHSHVYFLTNPITHRHSCELSLSLPLVLVSSLMAGGLNEVGPVTPRAREVTATQRHTHPTTSREESRYQTTGLTLIHLSFGYVHGVLFCVCVRVCVCSSHSSIVMRLNLPRVVWVIVSNRSRCAHRLLRDKIIISRYV